MKATGIILIIIGIGLTVTTSTQIFTQKKVADIGNVEITRDKPHNFSWSPVLGIVVIAAGCIVFWKSAKK
ncbi:MAG: hypothetical protein ABI199_04800 [Bacteroidia bacterium]